jgi:hypothetical protein
MLLHSLGAMGVDGRLAMALAAHGQHELPERVTGSNSGTVLDRPWRIRRYVSRR